MASLFKPTPQAPPTLHSAQLYLDCLVALSGEIEQAIDAIAENALIPLEKSVARQLTLSARLADMAAGPIAPPAKAESTVAEEDQPESLGARIAAAAATLQSLNRRYALLLHHSSGTLQMLTSLLRSHSGYNEHGVPPPSNLRTWSCQL
jgi:hypothetical protein